jgi:hypothetical protein
VPRHCCPRVGEAQAQGCSRIGRAALPEICKFPNRDPNSESPRGSRDAWGVSAGREAEGRECYSGHMLALAFCGGRWAFWGEYRAASTSTTRRVYSLLLAISYTLCLW